MTINEIFLIQNPTEEDHAAIYHGVNGFASNYGMHGAGGYFFAAYDENKKMIAAISGYDNFGPAEIGGLWVAEEYRNQGYGKALVEKAAEWGKQKGCKAVTVFTIKAWPACAWYQKLGFIIEYERADHANNAVGCYLIKKL